MITTSILFATASPVDLDVTIIIQVIIFFILLFVLTFLLYRPLLATIDARVSMTDGLRDKTKKLHQETESMIAEYDKTMSLHRKEAQQFTAELRQKVRKDEEETLEKAKKDASDMLQDARGHIKELEESMRKELEQEVEDMAQMLASKIIRSDVQN